MKNVFECLINNQTSFQVVDGDIDVSNAVSYTAYETKYNNEKYHILYDSQMNPLELPFEFLNYYLSDRSENTRHKAVQAIKLLLSID